MLAFGILAPVLPKLVLTFSGGHTLMQLVFSPLLGKISDRFGRHPYGGSSPAESSPA
jgi:MFS family permease